MMMHDICTFFCLHEGADVVVPYEVPDNLSVAWYFSVLYVPCSVRWLRWITSRRWLISHVATMFCEGRRAQSLQCIKLGDATGPTGQPLKPQPALAGASEPNRLMMLDICLNLIPDDGTVWGKNKFVGQ